jgi:preprotein translocase SecF subunit
MAFTFPKPIELVPQGTKIPFVSYFKFFFTMSIVLNVLTIVLLATVGLNFGIDFRGGTLMEIRTQGPADIGALRSNLSSLGLGEVQIQEFGAPENALIRVAEQPGGEKAQQEAVAKVQGALGPGIEVRRTEVVGGTVSAELLEKAVWAIVLTCLGIFIYVWFRFEWQFALGAIVALAHDVFLTVGVFSAFQIDFDLTVVAALLTILGYSINDTVVIYDRIRENLRKYKKMPLEQLLDLSVNETLSRTIMTVGTTFLALLALYLFGGEVIRGFTFAMLFGVIVGTYSSVFIAAPFLILIGIKRDWSNVKATPAKPTTRGRTARS